MLKVDGGRESFGLQRRREEDARIAWSSPKHRCLGGDAIVVVVTVAIDDQVVFDVLVKQRGQKMAHSHVGDCERCWATTTKVLVHARMVRASSTVGKVRGTSCSSCSSSSLDNEENA